MARRQIVEPLPTDTPILSWPWNGSIGAPRTERESKAKEKMLQELDAVHSRLLTFVHRAAEQAMEEGSEPRVTRGRKRARSVSSRESSGGRASSMSSSVGSSCSVISNVSEVSVGVDLSDNIYCLTRYDGVRHPPLAVGQRFVVSRTSSEGSGIRLGTVLEVFADGQVLRMKLDGRRAEDEPVVVRRRQLFLVPDDGETLARACAVMKEVGSLYSGPAKKKF